MTKIYKAHIDQIEGTATSRPYFEGEIEMRNKIKTEPYVIDKLTHFTPVFDANKQLLFAVWPEEQHRLNIVKTSYEIPEGTVYSVGFHFDGVPYHLESEMRFIPIGPSPSTLV